MQRTVFRTDHIVKVFVIHIGPPGVAVFFGLGAGIAGGKDAAALKNTLADPGCFVGAVRHHGFVLGVILAYFIVQRIKGYTVVDIAGSDVNTNNKIVLVTCCVRFVGKALFVLTRYLRVSGSVVDTTVSFSSGGFLSLSSEKGFLPCSSRSLFTSSNSSFAYRFACLGTAFFGLLFQISTCLNVGSVHKNRFCVQISFLCRGFQHPAEHIFHRGVVESVLEVVAHRGEMRGTASFSGYPMNHRYARFMLTSSRVRA